MSSYISDYFRLRFSWHLEKNREKGGSYILNSYITYCAGFDWDTVNFLHSSSYGAMFQICDFVMKTVLITQQRFSCFTAVFTPNQGLSASHAALLASMLGCTKSWKGTQTGQLTLTDWSVCVRICKHLREQEFIGIK